MQRITNFWKNNTYKIAIGLALLTAVFSGVNNFITKIAVTAVKDPVVFTTLKNAIVAVFIIGIIIVWKKRNKKFDSQAKKALDSYRHYWRQYSFYSVFYRPKTNFSLKRFSNP